MTRLVTVPTESGTWNQFLVNQVRLRQFHDALRDLAATGAVRLEPWTGAMYQLQAPECCLIIGREIMAYPIMD